MKECEEYFYLIILFTFILVKNKRSNNNKIIFLTKNIKNE